jgi:peptide deformylase
MILPIYGYGQPVLKKVAKEITPDYPGFSELLANMWETMEHAEGVGLAAPQIGLSIRLFVVDSRPMFSRKKDNTGIRKCFVNAQIVDEGGEEWSHDEGCLSIPNVRGDVSRKEEIKMRYMDEHFEWHEEVFDGLNARVIQHEYDHIEGILFVDHLKPIRRRLIRRKLEAIQKGNVQVDYRMKFR